MFCRSKAGDWWGQQLEEKAGEPMLEKEPLLDLSCRLHRGRGGCAKIYATYAEGRNAMPSWMSWIGFAWQPFTLSVTVAGENNGSGVESVTWCPAFHPIHCLWQQPTQEDQRQGCPKRPKICFWLELKNSCKSEPRPRSWSRYAVSCFPRRLRIYLESSPMYLPSGLDIQKEFLRRPWRRRWMIVKTYI